MITNAETILESVNIAHVIGEYIDLQHRGVNMVGNCPFHEEKSGSFTVNPAKQIYKCFGCGKGGNNAAKFLMDLKHISYPEALELLSSRVGVKLEYSSGSNSAQIIENWKKTKKVEEAQQEVMTEVMSLLTDKSIADGIEYAGKIYSADVIKKWSIKLYEGNLLTKSNLDKTILAEIGLIKSHESGRTYDTLQKRVLFPVRHLSGHFESIIARATDDKQIPKYINGPDSALYSKSKSVFGLWENGKTITERGFAYLCEGPTDVILLDQNGISNAVASCGTALTIDQTKRIARYTDRIIIIRDADAAGKKATERDIEIITKCNVQASVVFLPEGEDPASYVLKHGSDHFRDYVDSNNQDGILWRVSNEIGTKKDPFTKNTATELAARLLALIESDRLRESYIKDISAKIGVTQKIISDAALTQIDLKLNRSKKLTTEQEMNKAKFGVYGNYNKFFDWTDRALSNFVINPIFLVRADKKSYRVFEMINEDNFSILMNLDSDEMTTLNSFRKKTEMHGNYVYEGDDKSFLKVRRMIYSDMLKAYQLPHLGYIAQSNVYAWGNGITTPDGQFIPVDEYGQVTYEKFNYYLPAFSKLNNQETVISENNSDYEKQFVYRNTGYNFKQWQGEFSNLFGVNANIGIAFYVATIFADYVVKKFNSFPLLNLFGPAQSGKSTMAGALNVLFGEPIDPVHCITATWASFFRRPSQCANAIALYEEYSEKVDKERQEGLKAFYDRFARMLAKKESSNKTEAMPVYNTIVLIGQVLPTHDPALLTRCITVFFKEVYSKKEVKIQLDKYFKRGKKGEYSSVTAEMHSKRSEFITKFEEQFEDHKQFITQMFDGKDPSTRVLINYSILCTFLIVAYEIFDIKHNIAQIYDDMYDRIRAQNLVNEGATELLEFWSTLSWLIDNKKLNLDFYAVEKITSIRVNVPDQKNSELIEYEKPKKIMFIKAQHVHKEYMIAARQQGLTRVLDWNSMKYYLKINHTFIGETIKKHNDKSTRFWAFDADAISNIELSFTNYNIQENEFKTEPNNQNDLFTKWRPKDGQDFKM